MKRCLRAAAPTKVLNVDPGGYAPWIARLNSAPGALPEPLILLYCRWDSPPIHIAGSYVGLEAIATIRPVRGSITMAAPPVACRYFADSESYVLWATA